MHKPTSHSLHSYLLSRRILRLLHTAHFRVWFFFFEDGLKYVFGKCRSMRRNGPSVFLLPWYVLEVRRYFSNISFISCKWNVAKCNRLLVTYLYKTYEFQILTSNKWKKKLFIPLITFSYALGCINHHISLIDNTHITIVVLNTCRFIYR